MTLSHKKASIASSYNFLKFYKRKSCRCMYRICRQVKEIWEIYIFFGLLLKLTLIFVNQTVLNAVRILTRVIPYIFEDPDWRGFFWSSLPAGEEDGHGESMPLAHSLIHALCVCCHLFIMWELLEEMCYDDDIDQIF